MSEPRLCRCACGCRRAIEDPPTNLMARCRRCRWSPSARCRQTKQFVSRAKRQSRVMKAIDVILAARDAARNRTRWRSA